MTVSLAGEVVLTTGGWFDEETLKALNIVLRPIHMKVRGTPIREGSNHTSLRPFIHTSTLPLEQVLFSGDIEKGEWALIEGSNKRTRWVDNIRVAPKGQASAIRARVGAEIHAETWGCHNHHMILPMISLSLCCYSKDVLRLFGKQSIMGAPAALHKRSQSLESDATRRMRAQGRY